MSYTVCTIEHQEQFADCPEFSIDHFNWVQGYYPLSFGRLAYLKNQGFLLNLRCLETNPVRTFTSNNDPVYQDSALEAFINFYPDLPSAGYINFEINANGAVLSQYGTGRKNRTSLTSLGITIPKCTPHIDESSWSVEIRIPLTLIHTVYSALDLPHGFDRITCNFFKIKESVPKEHYASYSPISSETPDFHLPEFFASCKVQP